MNAIPDADKEDFVFTLYVYDLLEDSINVLHEQGTFDKTTLGADDSARQIALINLVQTGICILRAMPNYATMTLVDRLVVIQTAILAEGV